jgi:FAD synthetase
MKRVLVFGVFDQLHLGHMAFLKEALTLGDTLIVVLAQDAIVFKLKNREPVLAFEERKKALEALSDVSEVLPGDLSLGSYVVVSEAKPDIIAFGYDQEALKDEMA